MIPKDRGYDPFAVVAAASEAEAGEHVQSWMHRDCATIRQIGTTDEEPGILFRGPEGGWDREVAPPSPATVYAAVKLEDETDGRPWTKADLASLHLDATHNGGTLTFDGKKLNPDPEDTP
jgi:hypothetical protein